MKPLATFSSSNLSAHNFANRAFSPFRRTLGGALSGLAGAWAMGRFTRLWNFALSLRTQDRRRWQPLPYSAQEWDATSAIASVLLTLTFADSASCRKRKQGAATVHYAIGATAGALYAVLADELPGVTSFAGGLFGVAVWVVGSEFLMPVLGISRNLRQYSLAMQANALGEHVIYGIVTDRLLRTILK